MDDLIPQIRQVYTYIVSQNNHIGTLILLGMSLITLYSVFILNFKVLCLSNAYLKTMAIVLYLFIYTWSVTSVLNDTLSLPSNVFGNTMMFPLLFFTSYARTLTNVIITFATFLIIHILICSQMKNRISFNVLLSDDSWYIYPIVFYICENVSNLVVGGVDDQMMYNGWLTKLLRICDPHIAMQHLFSKINPVAFLFGTCMAFVYACVPQKYTGNRESHITAMNIITGITIIFALVIHAKVSFIT